MSSLLFFRRTSIEQERVLKLQTRPEDPLCRPLVAQRNASDCSNFVFKVIPALASRLHRLLVVVVVAVGLVVVVVVVVSVVLL